FTPGCDECFATGMTFTLQEDVNFGNLLGAPKPGYIGAFSIGGPCPSTDLDPSYNTILVIVYCLNGVDWEVRAWLVSGTYPTWSTIELDIRFQVQPCSTSAIPPYDENHF